MNKNSHDLDFVLERGGTPDKIGMPVAFIETAWRRYTKHSRNKAQEIQGALEPLAETYRHLAPFKGAVLAGVFTEGALTQLRSLGFTVLYFSVRICRQCVSQSSELTRAQMKPRPTRNFSERYLRMSDWPTRKSSVLLRHWSRRIRRM